MCVCVCVRVRVRVSVCVCLMYFSLPNRTFVTSTATVSSGKQELTRLQETLDKLSKKASFYEEQMDYFQRYVKACLDSLAKAGRYV